MALPTIKINEPQPVPCSKCGGMHGYQYSDKIKCWYTTIHSPDGKYEMGSFSDSQTTENKAVTPYCANCGSKLAFKLKRESLESVE